MISNVIFYDFFCLKLHAAVNKSACFVYSVNTAATWQSYLLHTLKVEGGV